MILGIEFAVKPFRDDVWIADGHYYETLGGSFISHSDNEWEAIRPEVWKDVTEECAMYFQSNDSLLCHLGTRVCAKNGYRLRKVQLLQPGSINSNAYAEQWAFIIEKKES